MSGDALTAEDRRLLDAFVSQLRLVQEHQRLSATAESVTVLEEANELRTALLAALSHDLRTPLAAIKAAATSLRSDEIAWGEQERQAFYEAIDTEADRLHLLVANLLDMSRIQTGAQPLSVTAVAAEEVVFAALGSLSGDVSQVRVDVPETLAPVLADPALLERSVANLLSNALTWSPPGEPVQVTASEVGPSGQFTSGTSLATDRQHLARSTEARALELRIADRGPGIPDEKRDDAFRPFQRAGDSPLRRGEGVGLGLAVARGFVDLMGGSIELDDTPGGGLTAVVRLPVAAVPVAALPVAAVPVAAVPVEPADDLVAPGSDPAQS